MKNFIKALSVLLFMGTPFVACAAQDDNKQGEEVYAGPAAAHPARANLLRIVGERAPKEINLALKVLEASYEAEPRGISGSQYGLSFPITPEILAQLMEQCQGKVVAGLGAADGINEILLGLAGAKRVYVNDIVEAEINRFMGYLNSAQLQETLDKFVPIQGDALKIGSYIPSGTVDILYARNLLHLLPVNKHERFFEIAKQLLTPDGLLVLSVHHRASGLFSGDPDIFCFNKETVVLDVFNSAPQTLNTHLCPSPQQNGDPLAYTSTDIAEFGSGDGYPNGCKLYKGALNAVNKELVPVLLRYIKDNRATWSALSQLQPGSFKIRVVKNFHIAYTADRITALLEDYGFEPVEMSFINSKGHTSTPEEGLFINIIAKRRALRVAPDVFRRIADRRIDQGKPGIIKQCCERLLYLFS
ncbi:MAG: hypothetical protein K0R52_784 [Alphaproteobacteria bacterium]|jgi:predicted nicotinamide N-methyase|nr:hypothetical protein [Alphaproteobacteria bacterium]